MMIHNKTSCHQWNKRVVCVIASTLDPAAMTIAKALEDSISVSYLENKSVLFSELHDLPAADDYIILSKHFAASKQPAFTVHSVGNFSNTAELGGKPLSLGYANAAIQSSLLHHLSSLCQEKSDFKAFEITAEATHHGPLLDKPVTFIEMGSDEEVWNDQKSGSLIAKVVTQFFSQNVDASYLDLPVAIAFGGTHYPKKHTQQMIDLKYLIGHICPKYAIPALTEDLVKQMIEKTVPRPKFALFDKKGTKRKLEIRDWVEKQGLEVIQI